MAQLFISIRFVVHIGRVGCLGGGGGLNHRVYAVKKPKESIDPKKNSSRLDSLQAL